MGSGRAASPPGESTLGSLDDGTGLLGAVGRLVRGVGTIGCGFEAQHESWYRFLVDPDPSDSIAVVGGLATPMGTDTALLTQCAAFLRPDSLLLIVLLSDEDDCSIRETSQFYFAAQQQDASGHPFHLPAPRAECATDPNDPCCRSCGQAPGSCPADPTCLTGTGAARVLSDLEDDLGVRCFDEKRRFGIDFLQPLDRYVTGLTAASVPNRAGELVPNPIFSDLDPSDGRSGLRRPQDVVLATIVGVPWQDLAVTPTDITQGLFDSASIPWDLIDSSGSSSLTDAHMIASIDPRAGLAPPGSPDGTDPIHGHEYSTPLRDDLQYACIFPLSSPRDCSTGTGPFCECADPANDRPNCADSGTGARTLQNAASAQPGSRHVALARRLAQNAVLAPVCAAQQSEPSLLSYGYRPAVDAILRRAASLLGH